MVHAVEQIRRMRGGAQSHLMRCLNELLGTRLAGRLGLPTAPVEVVEVSAELIRLTPELWKKGPGTGAELNRASSDSAVEAGTRGPAYRTEMIDQGFCFNAGEWNFPDAPLRGLYARGRAGHATERAR